MTTSHRTMDDKRRLLHDLDNRITYLQNVVLSLPRSDPERTRTLYSLAMERSSRYSWSVQPDYLESSILSFTEAIFLPLPWDVPALFLEIFHGLAVTVLMRAGYYSRPEDAKVSIMCFRFLRGQVHRTKVLSGFPSPIAVSLIIALQIQVKSNFGDVHHDVEEMADLCDELLNSDVAIHPEDLNVSFILFSGTIFHYLGGLAADQIPAKKVIDCLRRATVSLPHLPQISIELARCLLRRLMVTPFDYNHKEAMTIVDKHIHFRGPDDTPSPYRRDAMFFATGFTVWQFFRSSERPEDLEEAIYYTRTYLDEYSSEHDLCGSLARNLSWLEAIRLNGMRVTLPSTIYRPPPMLSSYRDLSATLHEDEARILRAQAPGKYFDALMSSTIDYLTDIADIQDGIQYCRQVLACPGSQLAVIAQRALPAFFRRAFECTNQIEYLNEAISATRHNISTIASDVLIHFSCFDLIRLLQTRLNKFHQEEDFDELMQLLPMLANREDISPERRSWVSCQWALNAHRSGHHSTSTAYELTMSSMQASLTFAPTLTQQHSRLAATSNVFKSTPVDYASYQIYTGQLKQAIETLERGRALLWSEMRGLRTSMDQIRLANKPLADKFQVVNKEIEALRLAIEPNNSIVSGGCGSEQTHPYGHLVLRQRKLLDDREKLISEVQAMPGFDTFLRPPSFDSLNSAASHGPVIIINNSMWRSDIIILLHDAPSSLIPTSDDFYGRAIKLQDRLLEGRGKALGSKEYEDTLRWVLKELYDLVGQAVIRRLNELGVPEQSRVWWCPTSMFCSLPLHAMGPIPSEVGPPRYFLDLYISSYTPSLSALIESRKPGLQTFCKPSMLLVVQQDASMEKASEEMKVVQTIRPRPTTLDGATATPTVVLEHLRHHQFVHFVCHGLLEPGKPFDSSFMLHGGECLSLLDIVRSQLPNAEFAFLAACHTAELTHESPADEALHLAAAMQYCGFRSVVGTMWAMADADGPDLARGFYGSLFSGRKEGVYYYERTAEALRDAVVKLRGRRGRGMNLERWVNYVHYGA